MGKVIGPFAEVNSRSR